MATLKYLLTLDEGVTPDSLNIQYCEINLDRDRTENPQVYKAETEYNISIDSDSIRVRFDGIADGIGKKAVLTITVNGTLFKNITILPERTGNIHFSKTYSYPAI